MSIPAAHRTITRWGLLPSFLDRRRALPLPERLLVIGPVGLGDTVLALPALRLLQRAAPSMRVVWIGRAAHEAVVRMAGVDGFVSTTSAGSAASPGVWASGGCPGSAGFSGSGPEAFDAVVTFGDVSADALGLAGPAEAIPVRIGADNGLRRQWCNHLVHTKRLGFPRHEALRHLRLLLPFGLPVRASLDEAGRLGRVSIGRATLPGDVTVSGPHVVLHPFSAGHAREWPLDHWVRLASRLADEGVTPVLTGSAEDGASMAAAWPLSARPPNLVDAFGRLDLSQLATLLADAAAVIACSTGPLHLAASLGAPAIGLFVPRKGLGLDRWAPLGAAATGLQAHRHCPSPAACDPSSCRCIRDLGVEPVARVVRSAVAGGRAVDQVPTHWVVSGDRHPAAGRGHG